MNITCCIEICCLKKLFSKQGKFMANNNMAMPETASQEEKEARLSKKPLSHGRSTKEESEEINKIMLGMIASNKDWRQIYYLIKEELKVKYGKDYTRPSLFSRYQKLMETIKKDIAIDIEETRAKRILSLEADIQEAYDNYNNKDLHPKIQQDWFKIYLEAKQQLDKFYPNALQPKEQQDDLAINISFSNVNKDLT